MESHISHSRLDRELSNGVEPGHPYASRIAYALVLYRQSMDIVA